MSVPVRRRFSFLGLAVITFACGGEPQPATSRIDRRFPVVYQPADTALAVVELLEWVTRQVGDSASLRTLIYGRLVNRGGGNPITEILFHIEFADSLGDPLDTLEVGYWRRTYPNFWGHVMAYFYDIPPLPLGTTARVWTASITRDGPEP